MPRAARIVIPEVALHVVQRGINRGRCFLQDADFVAYLDDMRCFATRFSCVIHAYCLMSNHVHLLLTPSEEDSCARMMKHVNLKHVQRINRRLGRTGTLWEGRFRSGLVASERYVLACYRYIESNPARAAMVRHPGDYRWSSFRANAMGQHDGIVAPHPGFLALGEDPGVRRRNYAALVEEPLEIPIIEQIRQGTRGGYVIGTARRSRGRRWSEAGGAVTSR